jgi:hypothetical protein
MWPTKEQQFILALLRASLGYESWEGVTSSLSQNLDWEKIAAMMSYHGIAPLLYNALQQNKQIVFPQKVTKCLAREYIGNSALGLLFEKALKEIVAHLGQNELSFAVHKGLGLSALVYPKPELRPCGGDFDLLIKKEDYTRAKSLLEEIGYCLLHPVYEKYEMTHIGEVKFVKPNEGKKLIVELHVEFNANPWAKVSGFDFKGFWDNLLWVHYNDFSIPCLPVEANLFFLILHCAANHNFDRLMMFCDIDLLIRKYEAVIDWEHIAMYARENHCRKALYYCLAYCRQLLRTPVPDSFLENLNPGFLSTLFLPTRLLLVRDGLQPKSLKKYMHVFLLDNPFLFYKSVGIFLRRGYSEYLIKKKTGASFS